MKVIIDPKDDSIELSTKLCRKLEIKKGQTRIFVFRHKDTNDFALMRVTSKFAQGKEVGIVSYNPKLKSYGFISLCPTVNMICYENGLSLDKPHTIPVKEQKLPDGSVIYNLLIDAERD